MLMSLLNGVNKELTGRVSLCAARAGGVMATVSVCNYTLSRCILAAVVGEQAAQSHTREEGEKREQILRTTFCISGQLLLLPCPPLSSRFPGPGPQTESALGSLPDFFSSLSPGYAKDGTPMNLPSLSEGHPFLLLMVTKARHRCSVALKGLESVEGGRREKNRKAPANERIEDMRTKAEKLLTSPFCILLCSSQPIVVVVMLHFYQ